MNAEELTELSAWTVRDHLGEFVNFYIGDGEEDSDVYLECALRYYQVEELRNRLTEWLNDSARQYKVAMPIEGGRI